MRKQVQAPVAANTDDFETKVTRKEKLSKKPVDEDSSEGEEKRIPLYLGITLHEDKTLNMKMKQLLTKEIAALLTLFSTSQSRQMVENL